MGNRIRKGATPYRGGCRFVVWAPHADEVHVTGTFNDWSPAAHALARRPDGLWTATVPGARAGDQYRYRIVTWGRELFRIDPYARRVTSSIGNAVVTSRYRRPPGRFRPPALNELLIYELHVGTFGKRPGDEGPGTIAGARERLPYLRDLGVNAVEIMPLAEFAGGYSWG